jgi:S-adenosylmethionine hydrolase
MEPCKRNKIVTLTTDFGLADHYVGSMRGVIVSRCPGAQIFDISHEIAAFSIYAGAYAIDQAAPLFPAGTVHVVVIDPGVGTARRAVLVEAIGQYFVAPDNGVLSLLVARDANWKAWEISNRSLWRDQVSATFHGRDIFAPVGGALAAGEARAQDVGPEIDKIELLENLEASEMKPGAWQGKVLSVDRFGNIVTNLRATQFALLAAQPFRLYVGKLEVKEWSKTFGAAPVGECFVYFGSSGYLEAGLNRGSAASVANATPGDTVLLKLKG